MDANGLRFWMLANQEDWRFATDAPPLTYDRGLRCVQLASRRAPLELPADLAANRAEAEERLDRVPQAADLYQTRAFWDAAAHVVIAAGAVPGEIPIYSPAAAAAVTDMAMGFDAVLYLAAGGQVVLYDVRERWEAAVVGLGGFSAWRLAAAPEGGAWVLDRTNRALARVRGYPLPSGAVGEYDPGVFRPAEENGDPPRLAQYPLPVAAGETPVAVACHPTCGEVDVLCWQEGADAVLLRLVPEQPAARVVLTGARYPYSLAWVAEDRVAVLAPELDGKEALLYALAEDAARVEALGDFCPLRGHIGEPLAKGPALGAMYATPEGLAPLLALSINAYATEGEATGRRLFDSRSTATVWHRLYLEAVLPVHCGVRVILAASDLVTPPSDDSLDWCEHRFGRGFSGGPVRLPAGAWSPHPSEVPFHGGFLPCAPRRDEAGLFTTLIQHTGRRTSTLRGRYLHVRVVLQGDGRSTPEVYALRAYGARFSYVEHYLPALYHENLFEPEAHHPATPAAPKSRADFLERFVDNFEGILTPLEDRIAYAWLLTDPQSTPEEALDWLGAWIGVASAAGQTTARRRELLRQAPELFRRRGTLGGLRLALDIATGGGVRGGEIVVVEDWRLRRTFVTILGADLADEHDPLLAGLTVSGNSYVGDTFFLADEDAERRKEFLALFGFRELAPADRQIVRQFLDRLAFRATVLVHQAVEPQDLGLIRQVVAAEKPAHIEVKVEPAPDAFRVGVAALVGVDSYLTPSAALQPVRIDRSWLGMGDRVQRPPSLDPRLEGGRRDGATGRRQRPTAQIVARPQLAAGQPLMLDGSGSQAPAGRRIWEYIWVRKA
ncbi:MAG: phage tail protein [Caldilineaceae bacterium]